MNIAYLYSPVPFLGKRNGIISQCLTWANELTDKGHSVTLLDAWSDYNWERFDIIHLFGSADIWFYGWIKGALKYNSHIVWSPICDNTDSPNSQYFKSLIGCQKLGLFSYPYIRRLTCHLPIRIFVRSNYECEYISKAYHVDKSKICIVPLSISYNERESCYSKEPYCFHLSSLYQPRKNVLRLVEAAKKYGFNLVLAGSMGSSDEFLPIKEAIGDNKNIIVKGRISEDEKIALYKQAKVFALPSIKEGVGIVALDAAHFGCDLVLTNSGGPKEYYDKNLIWIVDPYDIDEIGSAISQALISTRQPELKKIVDKNYSKDIVINKLIQAYYECM